MAFLNKSDPEALRRLRERAEEEKRARQSTNKQTQSTTPTNNRATSRTTTSSAPSSSNRSDPAALRRLRERAEEEKAVRQKKYTDYNTETKNAYTSVKDKINSKTTFKSNLSEADRKARLKEIDSELNNLNRALSGYSRAGAYGTSDAMKKAKQNTENRVAELSKEKKILERVGTFSGTELKQFEIDEAKAKLSGARQNVNSFGARPSSSEVEAYKQAVTEQYKAQEELDELKRQKKLYDDITKYGDVVNNDNNKAVDYKMPKPLENIIDLITEDGSKEEERLMNLPGELGAYAKDFDSQWRSNYRASKLSREADKASNINADNPTAENKELAYAYDYLEKAYKRNNEKALDDENVRASWLTKDLAGYLPQFEDQIVPELVGGTVGGIIGLSVGAPKAGWALGSGVGSGIQSYGVMRGSVYRTLLSQGVDEEIALSCANDEALINALIEGGETALSWLAAGGGKAWSAIGNAAKSSVAKGSTNAATKFVANMATKATAKATTKAAKVAARPLWNTAVRTGLGIGWQGVTEGIEEFIQGGVSRATRERAWASNDKEIGRFGEGNIDLHKRPIYKNEDGSISTVDSVTYEIDGKYVVLPTIVRDENGKAKRLTEDEEIVNHYIKTGEYLGKFASLEEANGYANKLHYAQAYRYSDSTSTDAGDNAVVGGGKVIADALFGGNEEAFGELAEQFGGGFRVGVMLGGSHVTVNSVITHYANAKTVKTQNEIADAYINDEKSLRELIASGKESGEGTVSEKVATEIENAMAEGKTVTRDQVKRLIESTEVYKQAEEAKAEPTTLEQAARDVVQSREASLEMLKDRQNGKVDAEMLETLSQHNVPITTAEVKKVTGLGDRGAELIAKISNTEGKTFTQAVEEVKSTYITGFNHPEMEIDRVAHTFTADSHKDAYTAGQIDAVKQNAEAAIKAQNARVFGAESGVVNKNAEQYTPDQMKMADTVGKDFGSKISFEERLLANEETGHEANAWHTDGEIKRSNTSDEKFIADIMEESLHRMAEMNTKEVQVLLREAFDLAVERGKSTGTDASLLFDKEKGLYDSAEQSINTRGVMEEVALSELKTELFRNEKAWNKWRERLDTNPELRSAWQKLCDFVSEIIEKLRRLLAEGSFSKATREKVNKDIADMKRMLDLYGKAYVATRDAVAERTKAVQNTAESKNEGVASENVTSDKENHTETKSEEKPKQAPNTSKKINDKTKNILGKDVSKMVVGVKGGRAYISNGKITIAVKKSDVAFVKSEWGLKDSDNVANSVEDIINNNEFVPISSNPVEGKMSTLSLFMFTTEDGRQIAIQSMYAKYLDGYNLSATFVKGRPYAIKATDANGNLEAVVMAAQPMGRKTYELTDTKDVSMKSFENKPVAKENKSGNKETSAKVKAKQEAKTEGIKKGDVFVADKAGIKYKILSRDDRNTIVEITSDEGTERTIISNEIADKNFSNMSDEGITKWVAEDEHIDNRTWEDVGNRQVKAFQYLFPEMKEYYMPLANELLTDLANTVKGDRILAGNWNDGYEWMAQERLTSEAIETIKDSTNASYDDIRDALERLMADKGQENIALAKRIELVFDDMLTKGYKTFEGEKIPANEEYIAKKEALIGKTYESKTADEDIDWLFDTKFSLSSPKISKLSKIILEMSKIKKVAGNKEIRISTDQYSVDKAIHSKKGRTSREVNARIKAIPEFEEIIRRSKFSHTDTEIVGLNKEAKKGVIAMHYFKTTHNGFDIEIVVRDKGKRQFLYEVKFIENKKSSQQGMSNDIDSPAPKGDAENNNKISQNPKSVNRQFSLKAKDKEYLELAKDAKKNETKLSEMVAEAAKEAGYIGTYYHGSKSDFTVFRKERGGASNSNAGIGFWFTESEEGAQKWADNAWWGDNEQSKVYKTYLRLNNPKVYETVDTKAQRDELYKGYEPIDKEMSLYDSIYYFEDGRRYHSERYDYDKSKRRHSSIYAWDAFKAIVKKYDADTIDYYLSKVDENEREIVKQDAERYLELSQERNALENQLTELRYSDAYELFRTDMYKQIGLGAEDANIGGSGKYVENKDEMLKKYVDMLKREEYDGIIIKGTAYDTSTFGENNNQYLVFDSNQVKSAEPVTYDNNGNVIPLSKRFNKQNDDIRYSLKDSEGKTLTKEQQEYFKDSKVRDDNGNLLVVYHGSPAKFTVFNHKYLNTNGNSHGRGFYFTEKKSLAEGYERKSGQLMQGYLNITNPLSEDKVTIKRSDFIKLIKATCNAEAQEYVKDGDYDNVQEALRDTWISNYVDTYNTNMNDAYREVANTIYSANTNDVELIAELTNAGRNDIVLRLTHDILGYDGVIYTAADGTHEFVSLVSEQFKDVNNTNPTTDPDIRYSLKTIKDKYADKTDHLYIYEKKNTISIDNMVVKKEYRNKGIGTDILNDIIDYADRVQKTITLTPTSEFGTKERLKKWYKANGFVENKGRNTDFTISDTMYRLPSDVSYSLKGGISNKELRDTIADAQKGKKAASEKLAKYVDSGIIPSRAYDELIEKYGVIPTGERPHRDIQVPRKSGKNKKVSQTVRTILEAQATPDEAVPTIEKMVEDGVFSYDVYTDKQALNDAESYIKEYGWDESLDDWFDAVNSGEVSKELTTMGWALYNNAANLAATTTSETERTTAIKTSLKILDAMVRHQRSAAQALQATRILKKLSPETQLYGVQKSVQALQNELSEKYGDKAPDLKIDEELAEQFINAKTPEERAEVEKEIYKDIGKQMPSRFIDKWNAWRYLAMLGNPRTHIRNIVGNAGFAPVVIAKDMTATAIESVVHRVSGKKTIRGKSVIWGSKADRSLLKAAWNDYNNVADLISNGGKYSDSAMANQQIEEGRQIFKFKPLEWARKENSKALETEDMWFSKPHYAYALAQYCKANNITAEQISKGKAIAPAREYAIKEAQKATYRDTNAFSQMVSEWGRSNKNEKNVVKKAFNTVIEGILPFRKTPANILVRGVEYSPLGLLKGLSYDLYQVGKGKLSATEAIDNISAGLTGTGLMALGVYLAAQGLIRGHGEDEEKEKEFNEMMGHQSYSLELPNGQSITLDWLAPEALPFFVGVNVWETTKGSEEETNLSAILKSVSHITEPMLEMSCLQGLNDLFEGIGYASSNDTSGLVSIVSSAVTSYLTQGIPTLLGQAERTFEAEREGQAGRMTTYTEKNGFLTGDMQYTLGKASAKIPFWDYNQIPYIDAWGRKEASGVALKRGLNNFLNPAYTSTIETSRMEEELLRLYEQTGEGGVFPERADKYFMVDGERKDLTAEEYVRYATLKGEKSRKAVEELVNSSAYQKLTDAEKVKAIEDAYDYANQKAKEAISNYKPQSWVGKADEFANVGNYLAFKTEVASTKEEKEAEGEKMSKADVIDIIVDMAQNDSEMWDMYLSEYDAKKDIVIHDAGVDGGAYMTAIQNVDKYDKPNKNGNYGTYTNDEIATAIRMTDGLSNSDKAILWQEMTGSTSTKNNPWRRYLP